MSNATERRERKLARELCSLATSNPERFKIEWRQLLDHWSLEAIRRGQMLRQEHAAARGLPVFAVLKKALRILAMCGSEAERLVGAKTRELLSHDCGKAFSQAVEPNLYRLGNSHHNEALMKPGANRPPK